MRAFPAILAFLVVGSLACDGASPSAPGGSSGSGLVGGDAARGAIEFADHCAMCHASGDGFDLAYFGFPDSTILRRASPHVDTLTALDIAAHVRALGVSGVPRGTRPFQPGGVVLVGDVQFATRLFGSDQWPLDLTSGDLAAIDPLDVEVAVALPRWSDESTNLDWMPDSALPEAILEARGGAVRGAIERYDRIRDLGSLQLAVAALRVSDRRPADPEAPCLREDLGLLDDATCFQVRRWTASFVAQHMVRNGIDGRLDPLLQDSWWDVGNAARLSVRDGTPIANGVENWAEWMLLGWMFHPERHASVYTGSALVQLGLPRHATFVALRSQVARPRGDFAPYADLASAARFAPAHWAYAATRFGDRELLGRLARGDCPPPTRLAEARDRVQAAALLAARKVGSAQAAELFALRDEVLAALD